MKRIKLFVLIFVVLMFAVSSVISTQRYTQVTDILTHSMKTVGWTASELELEMLKFMQALRRTALNDMSAEDLHLRFELLWSRVGVLSVGEETRDFRSQPGAIELLRNIKQRLVEIESEVLNLKMGNQNAIRIVQELKPLQTRVREFNVNSFSGDRAWAGLKYVHSLHNDANIFLLGLLLSGCILVLLLIRESAVNRKQALHDSLTGLANRHFFQRDLKKTITHAQRNNSRAAVHMIDMNGFKEVNDRLGHAVGDALLQEISSRLAQSVCSSDVVARLGGDEFGIIQKHITSSDECVRLAQHIHEQINCEINIHGYRVYPNVSIGISVFPDDAEHPDKLLNNADTAMYFSKKDADVCYRLFEQQMNDSVLRYRVLAESLQVALLHDQLQLVYQPIVCLKTKKIVLVEALLRWHHEQYGYISPPEVVSIAEKAGLAEKLNEWVLLKACSQNMLWRKACLPWIQVSVNISPAMYTRYDLVAIVSRTLSATGLPADQLVIEITEDTTMQDIESSPGILHKLRHLGVELALDDFGTGYSSLSHLKNMPFQKLKIDKVFIQELSNLPKDMSFIRTIINLAHGLGMKVVAEGIELIENYEDLYLEGCEYGQGYLFYKPVPSNEIEDILQENLSPIYFSSQDINT
ncbi:bifunctional diguanylate cyclase/phosphodiesterase [Moritella sp. 28]|uniref:putative bifunctional diguanylate cyclase/phosphodiesterase n=1 Tax=Moritella sp. 28 TaxID=2746232 RepID=UPI001BA6D8D4|nr:bifunctional diguanylate cyclase/phosphodiesterase [Moritella sp. 28]QUM84665.1 bifunctional diguanylate cyclase/phosphodiesterase [Moritella sp. 28]